MQCCRCTQHDTLVAFTLHLVCSGNEESAGPPSDPAALASKQELQDKQQAIIHKELQFLQGVHDQTRQIYTDLSQAAAPEAAQGIALFEANNRTKILSAIDHIVDQSVSQATQLLPAAVREEAPSSPKLNSSQQPAVNSTQAPSTPSQPSTQQFPRSFQRQPTRSVGIKRTHPQVSSQLNASHKKCQRAQQAASMPPVSLLLTRLTVLDVAQHMKLPDAGPGCSCICGQLGSGVVDCKR